ncbi:hypothetical protein NLI96_g4929 [Meripilus lineatus]|uniref:Uncharacterized protein n=1 Tax=Meripilus lineatus TaxID=2056292 RepID=A0AAD5V632_9APHY|nr:hypothetical protein NLI96_g4929 [Physisporinus lineatus]
MRRVDNGLRSSSRALSFPIDSLLFGLCLTLLSGEISKSPFRKAMISYSLADRWRRANDIIDIESKSPSLLIPGLFLGAHWVKFGHEGETYRCASRQAETLYLPINTPPVCQAWIQMRAANLEVYDGLSVSLAFLDISRLMSAKSLRHRRL